MWSSKLSIGAAFLAVVSWSHAATVTSTPTSSCAFVLKSPEPAALHCGVYGTLRPGRVDNLSSVASTYNACQSSCLENTTCIAYGFNYTSGICDQYGKNLVAMGLKVSNATDKDKIYYNRNCFVQQCSSQFSTIVVKNTAFTPISPSTAAATYSVPSPSVFYMRVTSNDSRNSDFLYLKTPNDGSKQHLAFTGSTDGATTFLLSDAGYLQVNGSQDLDGYNRFYDNSDYIGFDYQDNIYNDGASHPMVCNITSSQLLCTDQTSSAPSMTEFATCPETGYLEFGKAGDFDPSCDVATINALAPGAAQTPSGNSSSSNNCTAPFDLYHVEHAGDFTYKTNWTFETDGTLPAGLAITERTIGYSPYTHQFVTTSVQVTDGFLELIVPGGQVTPPYYTGEVHTVEDDILFASVRTTAILSAEPGVVNAAFFYLNDNQESDIEYVSNASASANHNVRGAKGVTTPILFTNQAVTPSGTETHKGAPLPSDFTTTAHEYRIDWVNGSTTFYIDGVKQYRFTTNVPTNPGFWYWNNWCNGAQGFSTGPPVNDAVYRISNIVMYYNTTASATYGEPGGSC